MTRRDPRPLPLVLLLALAPLAAPAACGGDGAGPAADTSLADSASDALDAAPPADTVPPEDVVAQCPIDKLPGATFWRGPYGVHRGELAADFTVPLVGGGTWQLSQHFNGCDIVLVLVDAVTLSAKDPRPAWDDDLGLAGLLARTPDNVHILFVSNDAADAAAATARLDALALRLDATLADLGPGQAAHWLERLHVVATPAAALGGWLPAALAGPFRDGLAIDRTQRLRGLGSLADVTQPDAALEAAGAWPWRNSIAYAAHEAQHLNADHGRTRALAARAELIVPLFRGEVLSEQAEVDVDLPAGLDAYGSLMVDLTLACPDPDAPELADNCGAWDYLASLTVRDDDAPGGPVEREVARFITSYHRESHAVIDATALLPLLASGGTRHFRWSFAPSWNPQPTATDIRLVFGDKDAPRRPRHLFPLFTGGPFNSGYNALREPIDLTIPAAATKVELWALTTGHGAGTAQCAEFCGHQHRFEVNGHVHFQTFPEAGTQSGCLDALVRGGVTPNQAGTWWYGRGGWCPGAPVAPWVVDVTSEVTAGKEARVTYRGLFAGGEPPDEGGDIVLTSYLVVWE